MAAKNLFALLIGINEYSQSPLKGCINDINRIQDYLKALPHDQYKVEVETLSNSEAIKGKIEKMIRQQLGKAGAGDIAFMYFSGHGVQEKAPSWLKRYEHDNKIECLVCYDKDQEQFLFADKELRYVFNQTIIDPGVQVITIFDCCHSGDNMRALLDAHTPRRMDRSFPARKFNHFIFSDDFSEDELENNLETLIPVRFDLHVSACRAYEQAFEDKDLHQGIFTNFLCTLLEKRNSDVRYIDIRQIAKMRFSSDHDKQIPEITARRKGNVSLYDGWLGRELSADRMSIRADHVNDTWIMNAGQMHGLQDRDEVTLRLNGDVVTRARIADCMVDKSKLRIAGDRAIDTGVSYAVELELQSKPVISCAVVDKLNKAPLKTAVEKFLSDRDQLGDKEVNFDVVLFNGFVYITDPGDHFRPRAMQLPIGNDDGKDTIDWPRLGYQLDALGKAISMQLLHNPATTLYKKPPLSVKMGLKDEDKLEDVTGSVFVAAPQKEEQYRIKLQLQIENISDDPVHVSAIVTSELGGIYTDLVFPEMSIRLDPGDVYEATGNQRPMFALEDYRRFYNWPDEHITYKLIVSSHAPVELSGFDQDDLEAPLLCGMRSAGAKGVLRVEDEDREPDWGTVDFAVRLLNPEINDKLLLDAPELACDKVRSFAEKNFVGE